MRCLLVNEHTLPRVSSSEGSNLRQIGSLDLAADLQEVQRVKEHIELHPQGETSKIQAVEKLQVKLPRFLNR